MKVLSATFIFRGWRFEFTRLPGKRRFKKKRGDTSSFNGHAKFKVNVVRGKSEAEVRVTCWHPTAAMCRRIKKHLQNKT